jgi:hypothetical protein
MKKPERASTRLVAKSLKSKATSARKKQRVSSLVSKGKVWSAVRSLYAPNNVARVREGVSEYFYPLPAKYNASKNTIHRNNRVTNRAIQKALLNRSMINIVIPLVGKGAKGAGVNPGYIQNAFKNANVKYATVGNNRRLKAFAFVKNTGPNSRYIDVIGAFPGYGSSIMNRVLKNAKNNGKKYVNLQAVTNVENNKNANSYPLVKWYMSKGFVRSGTLANSLLPMRRTL